MRALILSTGLFPIPPTGEGAVERHIYNLIRGLKTNKVDVEVVGQRGEVALTPEVADVRFHSLLNVSFRSETSFYGWLLNFLSGAFLTSGAMVSLIRKRPRFDVVHGHDALSSLVALSFRRVFFPNSKFVFTMHGYSRTFQDVRYTGVKRIVMLVLVCLLHRVCIKADRVILFTNDQARQFTEFHRLSLNRIAVIPQIVALSKEPSAKKGSLPEESFCLFVGRLVELKGVQDLIQAISGTDLKCVVVGSGPDEIPLKNLAESLGLMKQIVFTGSLPHNAVNELYRRARVTVHPSYAEGFPLVVLEALAVGLPVIAARTPGMGEVVKDGWNGLLYDVGDVKTLRSHIMRLFHDVSLRNRLAENATLSIQNRFDSTTIGRKTKETYETATAARHYM